MLKFQNIVGQEKKKLQSIFLIKTNCFSFKFFREHLDSFNERSLFWEDEDGERIVYLFDYTNEENSRHRGHEFINRHLLQELRDNDLWRLVRHPLVLNFVNEKVF